MSDLIRREDAYAAIRGLTRHIDRIAAITALPAAQPVMESGHWKDHCRTNNGPDICDEPCRKCLAKPPFSHSAAQPDAVSRDAVMQLLQEWTYCCDVEGVVRALPTVQPDAAAIREAALREAASYHELLAADEDALSAKYRGGSNPWFAHAQRASWHREHASSILALKGESHD